MPFQHTHTHTRTHIHTHTHTHTQHRCTHNVIYCNHYCKHATRVALIIGSAIGIGPITGSHGWCWCQQTHTTYKGLHNSNIVRYWGITYIRSGMVESIGGEIICRFGPFSRCQRTLGTRCAALASRTFRSVGQTRRLTIPHAITELAVCVGHYLLEYIGLLEHR